MTKPAVLLYQSNWPTLSSLSDEELGLVMRQVMDYACNGITPSSPHMAFQFIKGEIDRDTVKYEQTCERRREAAMKRYNSMQMHANACNSMQMHAIVTKEKEREKGKDEREREIESEREREVDYIESTKKDNAPAGADVVPFSFLNSLISQGVSEQSARDFLACRKAKRLADTETAFLAMCREAAKAGMTLEEVTVLCAERGWGGFKADYISQEDRNMKDYLDSLSKSIITQDDLL